MAENKFVKSIKSIKDNIKEKLEGTQDKKQVKAFARIIQFFMVMIVLTMIARGTQGATLATVETIKPIRGEISEDLSFDANVVARNAEMVKAPMDLIVKELFVGPGQKLEEGDSIVRFDTENLEDQLIRQQAKLDELKLDKSSLQQGTIVDDDSKETAQVGMARSVEDYQIQEKEDLEEIAKAEKKLKEAQDNLSKAQEKAKKAKEKKATSGNDTNGTPTDKLPVPEGMSGLDENSSGVNNYDGMPNTEVPEEDDTDPTLTEKEAVEQAKESLKTAQKTYEKNKLQFIRTMEDNERTLDSAELALYKTWLEANKTDAKNAITATVTQADIVKQQKVVDTLNNIMENDGTLVATSPGTILEIKANVGEAIAEGGEIAKITTKGGGYAAEVTLDKKQAKKVTVNMPVKIKTDKEDLELVVTSLSAKDESDNVTATINLPDQEWKLSQSLKADIQLSQKKYEMCLPIETIFSDSKGSFVLGLEEESTVLGIQNRLYKIPVTILVTGKTEVAVEGALGRDISIVKSSSKPVTEGDNVRVSGS